MQASKALIGRDSICKYLEISKNTFYDLVKEGLPVKRSGRRWIGHKDVIDEYFRSKVMTPPTPASDPPAQ